MENKYRDLHELPVTLRVGDLMPILGIGRNTAYELIRSGASAVEADRIINIAGTKGSKNGKQCAEGISAENRFDGAHRGER